jgi:hypothetical protein
MSIVSRIFVMRSFHISAITNLIHIAMTIINNSFNSITDWFLSLSEGHQVSLHNQFCDLFNYHDDHIYINDPLIIDTLTISTIDMNNFRQPDTYFRFNGYGKVYSFDAPLKYIDVKYLCTRIFYEPELFDITFENKDINI